MGWNKRERENCSDTAFLSSLFHCVLSYQTTCLLMKTETVRKERTANCPTRHTQRCVCMFVFVCVCILPQFERLVCLKLIITGSSVYCEKQLPPRRETIFSTVTSGQTQINLLNFRYFSHIQPNIKDMFCIWVFIRVLVGRALHCWTVQHEPSHNIFLKQD